MSATTSANNQAAKSLVLPWHCDPNELLVAINLSSLSMTFEQVCQTLEELDCHAPRLKVRQEGQVLNVYGVVRHEIDVNWSQFDRNKFVEFLKPLYKVFGSDAIWCRVGRLDDHAILSS